MYTVPAEWNVDLNRCTISWQVGDTVFVPIELIGLSCKISSLSRQRTGKALIRLRGCTGWYAPLLFTNEKNWFSHDVARFQINRSYLCCIRRKRVCCIQLYGEKKKKKKKQQQLLIYHYIRGHFLHDRHICPTCESDSENQVKVTITFERYKIAEWNDVTEEFILSIYVL